jgi:F0F1-type ATP synthase membrane subunit c/vacuolar-type H+-ATPase subunit K
MFPLRSLLLGVLGLLAASPAFAATDPALFGASDKFILMLGFAVIGAGMLSSGYALSISLSAYAACDKDRRGAAFIPAVMPGSQGLYSFAIGFLMINTYQAGWGDPEVAFKVALAGLLCGLPCLFSAIGQAKTAAACIKSINNGQMDQGQALLATGVPELYALVGLAAGFLVMN